MSKRRNKERAKQFIIRNGIKIPRVKWDKYQRELKEVEEANRLAKIGLVRGKVRILTSKEVIKESLNK